MWKCRTRSKEYTFFHWQGDDVPGLVKFVGEDNVCIKCSESDGVEVLVRLGTLRRFQRIKQDHFIVKYGYIMMLSPSMFSETFDVIDTTHKYTVIYTAASPFFGSPPMQITKMLRIELACGETLDGALDRECIYDPQFIFEGWPTLEGNHGTKQP